MSRYIGVLHYNSRLLRVLLGYPLVFDLSESILAQSKYIAGFLGDMVSETDKRKTA
jgi:hypothetical protein